MCVIYENYVQSVMEDIYEITKPQLAPFVLYAFAVIIKKEIDIAVGI